MALFDALIDDLASRFGLGATAAPLTREAVALIVGAEGGLAGFVNLFKRAKLDALVASWLGGSDPQPLTAGDLGKALGAPAIDGIAHRVGIALPAATAGLAYALPRLIGTLTPDGVVPATLPAEAMAFLTSKAAYGAPEAAPAAPLSDHGHASVADYGHAAVADYGQAPGQPSPVARVWLWPLVGVGSLAALGWGVLANPLPRRSPRSELDRGRRPRCCPGSERGGGAKRSAETLSRLKSGFESGPSARARRGALALVEAPDARNETPPAPTKPRRGPLSDSLSRPVTSSLASAGRWRRPSPCSRRGLGADCRPCRISAARSRVAADRR